MIYSQILDIINQNVKQNGKEEITGVILNSVLRMLLDFVNSQNQSFNGVLTTQTKPNNITKGFWFATEGVYPKFGITVPENNLGIIYWENGYKVDLIDFVNEQALKDYIDQQLVNINLGFGGEITSLTQSPTIDGMYIPKVIGIYPNFDNLEYLLSDGFVVFLYKDGIFSKINIPLEISKSDVVIFNSNDLTTSKAVEKYAVKKVNTIADLRNIEGEYNGQIISLLGYYKSGDKEPLNYVWKDVQDEDDGGYVINSGNGSWVLVTDKILSLKDFGAKGDNIQDDTIFIQNGFNYIFRNEKYKSIKITRGIYKITDTLKVPYQSTILGEGITHSILNFIGNSKNAIEVRESLDTPNALIQGDTTVFKDFSVIGELHYRNPFEAFETERIRLNEDNTGILVDSVLRMTFSNIRVEGFESNGIRFSNTYYHKLSNVFCNKNKVGLTIDRTSTSIKAVNCEFRLNAQGMRIKGSYANNFTQCLFEANIANYTDKISFDNSHMYYSGVAIVLDTCSINTFNQCYIEAHVTSKYMIGSVRNKFKDCFFAAGSHGDAFPINSMDGFSGVILNSDDNYFIGNEYLTSYPNVTCKYYFSNSKRAYYEFSNKSNFDSFISESNETINSLENKDLNPKAVFKGGNEAFINNRYTSYLASININTLSNSPKTLGSLGLINGNLSYYNGDEYLTIEDNTSPNILKKGDTSQRPPANNVTNGFEYFDTTLKKPVYSDNAENVWRDAMGNQV